MIRQRVAPLLALAAVFLASGCTSGPQPRAVDGVLDLTGWRFAESGSVTLHGDWAVCWGELLEPGAACPGGWQTSPGGLWSEGRSGSPFGGRGVATYRLQIALPEDGLRLSLRVGAPLTAHRLWIDGVDRGGSGRVGRSAATTTPGTHNRVHDLTARQGRAELWVQVANFEFRGGGLRRLWRIGSTDAIDRWVGRELLRDALLLGVTWVVGILYLAQFALRPTERARGYFGLMALVISMRTIPASVSDLSQLLLPSVGFAELTRLEYLGTALAMFAGAGYLHTKVEGVTPPRLMGLLQIASLALVPIASLAPFPVVLATLPIYLVLPLLGLGLVLVSYGRVWRREPRVRATFVAAVLYLGVVAHDVIRTRTGVGGPLELFPYFVVVWILAEAYELMRAFTRTFGRVESLSEQLAEANFELQETESAVARFVPFDFLRMLGKQSIRDVQLGDHARARMTVLHCAVHTEPARSEAAFGRLNELLERWERVVDHGDGFVSRYRGDGMQALFASPDAAVAAGRAILASVGPGDDVGVGIDTGPLLLGTVGGRRQQAVGALGDAIEGAMRIESLTHGRPSRLLISDRTRAGLTEPDRQRLRALDVRVESGAGPIEVFAVGGLGTGEPG